VLTVHDGRENRHCDQIIVHTHISISYTDELAIFGLGLVYFCVLFVIGLVFLCVGVMAYYLVCCLVVSTVLAINCLQRLVSVMTY